ncbi:MAG TPA: hypothetical protein QGH84_02285, partial [Rhodospirillales bacterium]|nr:hypothetical protein [Rhodospirillales bacterium]
MFYVNVLGTLSIVVLQVRSAARRANLAISLFSGLWVNGESGRIVPSTVGTHIVKESKLLPEKMHLRL